MLLQVLAPIAATFVVSVIPIGVLFLLPRASSSKVAAGKGTSKGDDDDRVSDFILNIMLSFSAGSLIGDALLHLFIHDIFSGDASAEKLRGQAMGVIVGIAFFLSMDIAVRLISTHSGRDLHGEKKSDPIHAESSHDEASPLTGPNSLKQGTTAKSRTKRSDASPSEGGVSGCDLRASRHSDHDDHLCHASHGHCHSGGILSLFADALHNFTDGLALAVTFSADFRMGLTTTVAIFLHEVPHQIGDYAILVKSGFSHKRAIGLQLVTAIAAFVGVFAGTAISYGLFPGARFIDKDSLLPFTAGGFLYIGMVSILPEVLMEDPNKEARTICDSLCQLVAFVAGIALLAVIE